MPSTDGGLVALPPPPAPPPGSPLSSSSSRISSPFPPPAPGGPPPLLKRGLKLFDLPLVDSDTLFRGLMISPLGGILPGSSRSRDDKFPEGLVRFGYSLARELWLFMIRFCCCSRAVDSPVEKTMSLAAGPISFAYKSMFSKFQFNDGWELIASEASADASIVSS